MNVTIISDAVIDDFASDTVMLAKELKKNNKVDVILPFYENEYDKERFHLKPLGTYEIKQSGRCVSIEILYLQLDSINFYFVSNTYLFSRSRRTGYADDAERSAVFCNSALELFRHKGIFPDYVISVGCFCALVPIYLKLNFSTSDYYRGVKSFHIINDTRYGVFDKLLSQNVFGIYESNTHIITVANEINLTKGAIICASRVFICEGAASMLKDTNSPCHASIIQFGFKIRKLRIGIDYELFNPQNDNGIFERFSPDNIFPKEENKTAIQRHYGFEPKENTPLIIMYSGKGNLITEKLLEEMIKCNIHLVLIGDNKGCTGLDKEHFALEECTDFISAKALFSGADYSIFTSLEQAKYVYISCAYGCVPMVPVCPYFDNGISYYNKLSGEGNGFSYTVSNRNEILYTLWDAVGIYRHDPKNYFKLISNTMKRSFSISSTVKQIEDEAKKSVNISF